MEWNGYLMQFNPMLLSAYQQKPELTSQIFIKAFKWEVWVVFLTAVASIVIVTVGVESLQNLSAKLAPVVLDVLGSIVGQDLSRNTQMLVNKKPQNMLHAWLLLWIVLMVVLNSAYLGITCSLIAKGIPPDWPLTLGAALGDSSYAKLTTSSQHFQNQDEVAKRNLNLLSSLHHILKEMTPEEFRNLYGTRQTLVDTINFRPYRSQMNSFFNFSEAVEVTGLQLIDNKTRHTKIIYIDFYEESLRFQLYWMTLYSKYTETSGLKVIPGIQRVIAWLLRRNFYTAVINWGLGQLHQLGFLVLMEKLINNEGKCVMLAKFLNGFKHSPDLVANNLRTCRYFASPDADLNSLESDPIPLSLKQMRAIFYVFLRLSVIPSAAMLGEMVRFKLFKIPDEGLTWRSMLKFSAWNKLIRTYVVWVTLVFDKWKDCGKSVINHMHNF